jgi:hypothetical protein
MPVLTNALSPPGRTCRPQWSGRGPGERAALGSHRYVDSGYPTNLAESCQWGVRTGIPGVLPLIDHLSSSAPRVVTYVVVNPMRLCYAYVVSPSGALTCHRIALKAFFDRCALTWKGHTSTKGGHRGQGAKMAHKGPVTLTPCSSPQQPSRIPPLGE